MHPAVAASPAGPELAQRLTLPVSRQYWKGWDAVRGICELVANARDEGEFAYTWADGTLTIEDSAGGIGDHGLVLGLSEKTDEQIGQFGEGLLAAMAVLARDDAVGRVRVETVGYAFEPAFERAALTAVGSNRAGRALPEVLTLDIEPCGRAEGTRITIECPQRLAKKAHSRFLFLTDPDYRPARGHGTVLAGKGGRVYIGGVLVSENRKLRFSYDFPLAHAKAAQNRDRTLMDANVQNRLISDALNHLEDRQLVGEWVDAALAGELPEAEQCFSAHASSPALRRVMTAIGDERYRGRKVCFTDGHQDAAAVLSARHRGYDVLDDPLGRGGGFATLMAMLGVPSAKSLYTKPRETKTQWLKAAQLTDAERDVLNTAVEVVRAFAEANGHDPDDALDRVDAYEWTREEGVDAVDGNEGFFLPASGRVGVKRSTLASLSATLRLLGHEAAHKLAHARSPWDCDDYTAGFERTLDGLLGFALELLHSHGVLDTLAAERQQRAAQRQAERDAADARRLASPAHVARTLLAAVADTHKLGGAKALSRAAGVSEGCARQILKGARRNGHVTCPAPKLRSTLAVADALDVDGHLLHVVLLTEGGLVGETVEYAGCRYDTGFSRRMVRHDDGSKTHDGRILGTRGDELETCLDALRRRGDLDTAALDAIDTQLQRSFATDDGAWTRPYLELLAAERDRLRL